MRRTNHQAVVAVGGDQLPAETEKEIARLAATIDLRSPASVASFGEEIAQSTARYSDRLLTNARSSDLDEIGAKLNEVLAAAQSFDLSGVEHRWARKPVIGPVVRQFVMSRSKALARFSTVSANVDGLIAHVDGAVRRLSRQTEELQAMHEGVCEEHDSLDMHRRAAQRRLDDLRSGVELEVGGPVGVQEAVAIALDKRIADMTLLQHSAFQALPMIRVMQANNLMLVEKFQTIQRLTIPAWKRTFTTALALNEQRDAVRLANSIDDATNDFMRRNAELLHQNALATAKANQRLVIDVDTLRDVHDQVLRTLSDVRSIHAEGARARREAIGQIASLREDMAAAFRPGAAGAAA